jgi:hypothetical protein
VRRLSATHVGCEIVERIFHPHLSTAGIGARLHDCSQRNTECAVIDMPRGLGRGVACARWLIHLGEMTQPSPQPQPRLA